MNSGSFLKRLKARDFNMCKCGHTRFWHEGKCLMSMQNGEGNEEFFDDCCQCFEFQLLKSIAPKLAKQISTQRQRKVK
jgi:hypothetical protein